MPLDIPRPPLDARVRDLNERYQHHSATAVLEHALHDPEVGSLALVSSFGAESVVLLHLVSVIAPGTPVLFIDTQMLFAETLDYQRELAGKLNLTDVRTIRADQRQTELDDPDGTLHQFDTDACCALRKVAPLERALLSFDGWITGRKRFQLGNRAALEFFENEQDKRIKVNPLAHWGRNDIEDYIVNNRLPRHPLVASGYPSIGCQPCTSVVEEGEDPRAGRWRSTEKQECGIHFVDGKAMRGTPTEDMAKEQLR
ncbi:MAG: phosphoadenylyl-sulfate reductase [Albidovulum sp.]